jgi:hypothetical protein
MWRYAFSVGECRQAREEQACQQNRQAENTAQHDPRFRLQLSIDGPSKHTFVPKYTGDWSRILQNGAQFDPQPAINPNRLPAPGVGRTARNVNSYRNYTHKDVDRMRFVTRGRELGFSLDEIRSLLRLAADSTLSCAEADQVARRHPVEVRARIAGGIHATASLAACSRRVRWVVPALSPRCAWSSDSLR